MDEALENLSGKLDEMYSAIRRPSIPPEQLLKGSVLSRLCSIRSERQLCEQFMKHDLAHHLFKEVVEKANQLLSDENGAIIEAAASLKSLRPKDEKPRDGPPPDDRGNPTVNGMLVGLCLMVASGTAERDGALKLVYDSVPGTGRITVGANTGNGVEGFIYESRHMNATPHVARKQQEVATRTRSALQDVGRGRDSSRYCHANPPWSQARCSLLVPVPSITKHLPP